MRSAAVRQCEACGADTDGEALFCSRCGTKLGAPSAVAGSEAERKQVTVLFSDLTGYTALSERLDPEETREILTPVFARAAEIVGRYQGHIDKLLGDAVMAIFGVPAAHEDDPIRAVRAALELHEAVRAMAPGLEVRTGAPIALHSGINTGLVLTGELRFGRGTAGPVGDTINLASRLMNAAPSGEIWIGPETRHLVERFFTLEDLGPRTFKGKAEPVAVARVRGMASRATADHHRRGTFVGRHEELGVLLSAAEKLRDGQPGVIAICGDAGTGKTRLVEEFRSRLGDDVQWLEGRGYPYAENIPYFPLIDLLNRSWGIDENDTPAAMREKLETAVSALVGDPGDALPVIARLYDLEIAGAPPIDREAFQGRLLDTLRRLLTGLVSRAPTVICLQDLHWADASTVTMIHGLTGDLRIPALLVGNYRPGYDPGPGARVLELRELSARQTRELLQSILDAEPPADLTRFIEERSDGNPFYVEEVVNSLVETGVLARNGTWRLAGSLAAAQVPATIRGVIAARIDRLDEPRRRVLRNAAVVGREFLYSVVAELIGEGDALRPSLAQLESADLIRVRSREADIEYIFKHALTQEVAYDGLLKSERQKLHERVAYAMERVLADRIPEFVETLAYHFLRGGVVDKAVRYLIEAGKKCMARYAIADAAVHYRQAYELLAGRERTKEENRALIELINEWSLVHYYQAEVKAWRQLLEAHREDAESLGDPELLSLYLGWTGWMLWFYEDYATSLELLDRAVRLAEEAGSRRALAYAETLRVWTLAQLGRTREAVTAGERAMAIGRDFPEEPYLTFKPLGGIAQAAFMGGDLERAKVAGEELLAIAGRTGNSRAAVLGHSTLAMRHSLALEHERAVAAGRAAVETSLDLTYRCYGWVMAAFALLAAERPEAAARVVGEGLPLAERLPVLSTTFYLRLIGASAAVALGDLSRGMRTIEALPDAPPSPWAAAATSFVLGLIYARTARREVDVPLSVLLRNPGFVIRHALPARRKARALLERIADDPPGGVRGYSGLAMLELARLHAHFGEHEQASRRAAQAIEVFERQKAEEALRQARQLLESPAGNPRRA
jgi:predicted ATPase/class 3 adenylate cyclase